ncbi:carboxypeptidase-like regulatory domain-containing protein [Nocardiopsis tropica]|uniref:Carboxypeptidase-like regulatory domain-containing protein n=1 Tax=Nocardiopsis tropica TaxID=109330 RepID=A0ABV2A0Z3_9ACTN|nr:carboxypeptidase-like regulatory domain-containing protein [Nocardiopsis tropica]
MAAITGTVYDSSGQPVEGVVIQWSSNEEPPVSSHERASRSIDDGSYRLVLHQGSWDVHGTKDGTRTEPETVVLGADGAVADLHFP